MVQFWFFTLPAGRSSPGSGRTWTSASPSCSSSLSPSSSPPWRSCSTTGAYHVESLSLVAFIFPFEVFIHGKAFDDFVECHLIDLIEFLFKMDVLMKYAAKFFNIKYPTPPNSWWQSIFNLSLIPAVTFSSPLLPFSHFKVNKSLSFQSLQPRGFSVSVPQFKGRPNCQKPFQLVTYNKFQNKIDIRKVKIPSRDNALP